MVDGRSFFANAKGIMMALRSNCGRKANLSSSSEDGALDPKLAFGDEFRYSNVLYGEKL